MGGYALISSRLVHPLPGCCLFVFLVVRVEIRCETCVLFFFPLPLQSNPCTLVIPPTETQFGALHLNAIGFPDVTPPAPAPALEGDLDALKINPTSTEDQKAGKETPANQDASADAAPIKKSSESDDKAAAAAATARSDDSGVNGSDSGVATSAAATTAAAAAAAAVADDDSDPREHLNLVFIGHVDAGKSTIGGQILFLTNMVDERTIQKYEREAKEKNRESWYMAYVMDTNEEERAKGKTVEVGRARFETKVKRYTVLDAPGID